MDVSDIFYFFRSEREKGESEAPGGGGIRCLLKIPGGARGFLGGARGREGICGELGNLRGGGGLNIFFLGPKRPPRKSRPVISLRNFVFLFALICCLMGVHSH